MKRKNTMGKIEFFIGHIEWAVIAMIWYKSKIFRCIGALDAKKSGYVLWLMILGVCTAGICLEFKARRNGASIMQNLLIAYGLYTAIVYFEIKKQMILVILAASCALSAVYALMILGRRIQNRCNYKRILFRRIWRAAMAVHKIFAVGLAVLLLVLGINVFFDSTVVKASIKSEQGAESEQTIANNMETLLKLQDNIWKDLSAEERLGIMQTVADIEQRYLGLPDKLNVGTLSLEEGQLGYYVDNTKKIIISVDSLLGDSALEVLDTVCHEAYHSYEHRIVEVYKKADKENQGLRFFKQADTYVEEFGSYVNGKEDFCIYYEQNCERDAREYARKAVYDYCEKIGEYLEKEKENSSTLLTE